MKIAYMCYYVANLHKIIETINLQMKKRYYLCNNVRENKMQVANMAGLLTKSPHSVCCGG